MLSAHTSPWSPLWLLAPAGPRRETLVRGDDLAHPCLAVAVVGRRVEREAQRGLRRDLEARELQIEPAARGVCKAPQPLLASAHVLLSPDRREVGTAVHEVGDERLVVRRGRATALGRTRRSSRSNDLLRQRVLWVA